MDAQQTRNILEACLLVAGRAMSVAQLEALFESDIDKPDRKEIKAQLEELQKSYEGRGIELIEVASGWRLQSRSSMEHWVSRLFTEKSPRYSRALLETLVLIAYRQPITRGEIEEIRGVAVSSNIIRTLQEREWVKEVGFKEVPGRPALLGTTRQFLDYFNLKRLDELPPLSEIKDLEEIDATLAAEMGIGAAATEVADAIVEAGAGVLAEGAEDLADDDSNEDMNSGSDEDQDGESDDGSDDEPDSGQHGGPDASSDRGPGSESENDALGELDPQTELRRVISEFAEEHQRELDVQKDIDTRNLTTVDDDATDAASDELDVLSESDGDTEQQVVAEKKAAELVAEHEVVGDGSDELVADPQKGAEPEP